MLVLLKLVKTTGPPYLVINTQGLKIKRHVVVLYAALVDFTYI